MNTQEERLVGQGPYYHEASSSSFLEVEPKSLTSTVMCNQK